jgi:hypothetical protein
MADAELMFIKWVTSDLFPPVDGKKRTTVDDILLILLMHPAHCQ